MRNLRHVATGRSWVVRANRAVLALVAAVLGTSALADSPPTPKPDAKAAASTSGGDSAVKAAGAILLKDWKPDSSLVVPVSKIPTARFPVIDVHSHAYQKNPDDIAKWVATMDAVGVDVSVILAGVVGEEFDKLVELYLKPYPTRFVLYAGIYNDNVDALDYPQRAVAELDRVYKKGARGLGELSDKGSGYAREFTPDPKTGVPPSLTAPPGKRLHPDDPRLDLFWQRAAELNLPANLHVADHPSAWRPIDNHQERLPGAQKYNQHGKNVASYDELLEIRDRLLARHPKNTFILCHLSNQGNDLASLSKAMDRFSNLYLDIAARSYEIGRQPKAAAKFITKYRDRVLFGTDQYPSRAMYEQYWRVIESADEYMPGPSWWRLYGLELPASTLQLLYRDNARKIMNWSKG